MRQSRVFLVPVVGAVLAVSLTGCFGSPDAPGDTPSATATDAADTDAADTGASDSGSAGTVVGRNLLAEQTVDAPNPEAGGSVTVGLRSLVVDGDVMTLRWTLGWENDSGNAAESANLFSLGVGRIPAVIDGANLVMYRPFCEDGSWKSGAVDRIRCEGSVVVSPQSVIGIEVPNGGQIEAWAVFPAVADGVETVDVQMPEGLPGFTQVTVARADEE